jgi:hypothetical protein
MRGLAIVALLLVPCGFSSLWGQTAAEYELKAAFLYRFASFVEWPHGFARNSLCIGVIGRDPFGAELDRVVLGRTVNGLPFRIRRFKSGQDVRGCEIVFISSSESSRLPSVLERLKGTPTLTVGDVPEFCDNGGMVNLRLSGDHVHLQINLEAAARSNLQLSSKLLNLASVVRAGAAVGSQ